jgi:hypothetical protein
MDAQRNGAALLAVAALSFVLNQAPFVFSSQPRSLGADGDSWFHVAIQMHLRDPTTFANDPEVTRFYLASRPPIELTIHRAVIALARFGFGGDLLLANIAGFWVVNLVFLSGCLVLGRQVLRSQLGAIMFAAGAAGLSFAFIAWWGMPFGAVIPHDVGLSAMPWLLSAYLRWDDDPRRAIAVFAAIGLVANLYPLQPMFLALVLLGTTLSARGWHFGQIAGRGLAFAIAALPAVLTAAARTLHRLGRIPGGGSASSSQLFDRFYGHLLPDSPLVFFHRLFDSPLWVFVAIALVAVVRSRRTVDAVERRLIWFGIWGLVLSAVGLGIGAISRPTLAFLFHRASALVYIPAYLGTIAVVLSLARGPGALRRLAALLIAVLLSANAWWRTPLASLARGSWPLQASPSYYQLSNWAREQTPRGSLFLVPYGGRTTYFAFRVYAERPVMLHYALGEMVLADPSLGARFARMEKDVTPLYQRPSSTAEFLSVAKHYGVRYIITDGLTPSVPDLPIVFWNADFRVFDAGAASGSSRHGPASGSN